MDPSPSPPQGHYRQLGVVLRSQPSGERGKNLFLLLREFGPVWVSVPGAASARSQLSGATEPLVWGYFTLYRSPRRTYVKEVEVQEDFWSLRQDRTTLATALRLCGHLVRFALPGHPQDELMPLLYWSFKALESGTEANAVEFRFLYRWSSFLGLSPRLDHCGSCGNPADFGLLTAEGLTCGPCLGKFSRQSGLALGEIQLNRLRKAVMLSGKEFRATAFGEDGEHLFRRASALFMALLEGNV